MFYLLFAKKLQLDTNGLNIKSEEMFVIEIVSFHQKEKKTYLFTKYYFRFICTIISWKLFIIMKISEYHLYYFLKSKAVCKRWTEVKSAVGIIFSRCWVFCLGILNFDINIWFKTLLCQRRSLQTNVPILVGYISFERTMVESFLERLLEVFLASLNILFCV